MGDGKIFSVIWTKSIEVNDTIHIEIDLFANKNENEIFFLYFEFLFVKMKTKSKRIFIFRENSKNLLFKIVKWDG